LNKKPRSSGNSRLLLPRKADGMAAKQCAIFKL